MCVLLGSWKINFLFYPSFIFLPLSFCWGSAMQVSLHLGSQSANTDCPLLAWSLRVSLGKRVKVIWKHIHLTSLQFSKLLNFLHILRVSAFGFYNRSDIKISSLVVILISSYVKKLSMLNIFIHVTSYFAYHPLCFCEGIQHILNWFYLHCSLWIFFPIEVSTDPWIVSVSHEVLITFFFLGLDVLFIIKVEILMEADGITDLSHPFYLFLMVVVFFS